MESTEFGPLWERHKDTFKQQHSQLTNDDLAYTIGKEGELLERLEAKSGKTKREIQDWLHIMG